MSARLTEPITYVRTGQAARILGVSRDTVVRLVANGTFSAYRPAGSHRYLSEREVSAYKAEKEQRSTFLRTMTEGAEASGVYDIDEALAA
ncbi:MAG: helix-turn-helix domain-containing protein [Bifidobacteriaceae bacterium]|jgi:excisionase family DNA binding protein|nr:helix-turn-helix domain-containing protein [Bifidobacteriaceae bacterium]